MRTITVSPQGQITIPADLRKTLDLKDGVKLILDVVDWVKTKAIVLRVKPKNISTYSLGLGKDAWWGVDSDKYIKQERDSWDKKYE